VDGREEDQVSTGDGEALHRNSGNLQVTWSQDGPRQDFKVPSGDEVILPVPYNQKILYGWRS
jgi:hypothetical protein